MNTIQLKIAEPCNENWANMQANEQGRFCNSCKKNVIDFTQIDNKELINIIMHHDANICGHFNEHQLNVSLPTEAEKRSPWKKYFFSFLVSAFLFAKQTVAQKAMGKVKATKTLCNPVLISPSANMPGQRHFEFSGTLIDAATSNPITGATVQITNIYSGTATDDFGKFTLTSKISTDTVKVIITAIGYETKEIIMAVPGNYFTVSNEIIKLNQISTLLGEVVVASNAGQMIRGRVGGVCISSTINKYSLLSNRLMTAINDSIKISPNPVQRGAQFSTSLKLKEPGRYILQVVDAAGRIVEQQQLNAVSTKHQQKIICGNAWSSGVYFLRVLGYENKLVSNSRFVVK